jgi:RNA polymerase sigma-70 factor (ECF subfamily)
VSLSAVYPSTLALSLETSSGAAPLEGAEATWVERARAGDTRAFRALHAMHAPALGRFLRDLLGDDGAAEEALQETFVRAFLRLDTLREDDRILAWLLGIGRRVSLEMRRCERRYAGKAPEDMAECLDDHSLSPEMVLLSREAHAHLDAALATLSVERRTILLLRSDHDLSCAEVAEVMGWSVAKVKVELFRARQKLRALLGHLGDPP